MTIVQNNPFRILGIPINAKAREVQKQITKATRFAEVGKEVIFETDFNFLGELHRNSNAITEAISKLQQPNNKILYSLFWFWNNNHIDEAAFDNLKNQNFEKALDNWSKVVKDGTVSGKNYSNLSNLKSLLIGLSVKNGGFNKEYFLKGVSLAGIFFSNPELENYCREIGGENFIFSSEEIQDNFISALHTMVKPYINGTNGISTTEFLNAFSSFSAESKSNISKKFTSDPIARIENEIDSYCELRKAHPLESISYGNWLYNKTKSDLSFLKNILGSSDLKYQMLANKLANEILQNSIDFFNSIRDLGDASEQDGQDALALCLKARSIVCGGQPKSRIDESFDFINKWVKEAPERLKQEKSAEYVETTTQHILGAIEKLNSSTISAKMLFRENATSLISQTKAPLAKIRMQLGYNDPIYLTLSSEVVQVVLAMMLQYVNATSSVVGV